MTLIFRLSWDHFMSPGLFDMDSDIFYMQNEAEIIMYRRVQGFIFKAIFQADTPEDMSIFMESHLKSAYPILGVENDPEIENMANAEKIRLLQSLANDTDTMARDNTVKIGNISPP